MLRTFGVKLFGAGVERRVVLERQADHVRDRVLRRLRQRLRVIAERGPGHPKQASGLDDHHESAYWHVVTRKVQADDCPTGVGSLRARTRRSASSRSSC